MKKLSCIVSVTANTPQRSGTKLVSITLLSSLRVVRKSGLRPSLLGLAQAASSPVFGGLGGTAT